jgi:DNA-binding CsgD family transcriptional regulator
MTGLRSRALCQAARGDLEQAEASVTAALREEAGVELVLEVARTHLVAGVIIRRRRRKRDACLHLERALRTFEVAGAHGWACLTAEELARARPRGGNEQGLSPTEERVARLLASGLTNRDAAARLNVSTKTVEANLARIYRKLQIHSRAQLGARYASPAAEPRDSEAR